MNAANDSSPSQPTEGTQAAQQATSTSSQVKASGKVVACYVRVSTTDQNEAGQRAELQQWLAGNGMTNVQWYFDKATGDNMQRPAFEQLQQAIFNGQVGTVVVWKLDRLSRKLRDGITCICDWCDRGLRIVSVTQQIDFNGTVGKLIASVLLGVAQMEQETRRERQAAGIAVAKQQGKYTGRRKGSTKAKPARARKLHKRGWSHNEIANAMGIHRTTVVRYLRPKK